MIDKQYTDEEISKMLDGYIQIPFELWDYIPTGAHIRYVKTNGEFKPGGFVRNHYISNEGKKMIMLETRPFVKHNVKQNEQPGYFTFSIAYDNTKTIFKKYPRDAFIEIHMISASLAKKKEQIENLQKDVKKLTMIIGKLNNEIEKRSMST